MLIHVVIALLSSIVFAVVALLLVMADHELKVSAFQRIQQAIQSCHLLHLTHFSFSLFRRASWPPLTR